MFPVATMSPCRASGLTADALEVGDAVAFADGVLDVVAGWLVELVAVADGLVVLGGDC
jgi:hypothetical protein